MKLIIPHESDYRLEPPATQLWMKRHYCPMVVHALRHRFLSHMIGRYASLHTLLPNGNLRSHLSTDTMGLLLREAIYDWDSVLGPINKSAVILEVRFYPHGYMGDRSWWFNLDHQLYLIPYMFKAVPKECVAANKRDLENLKSHVLVPQTDHCQKLVDLGLMEKSARTRVVL